MSDKEESNTLSPPAKKIRYEQGQLKGIEKLYSEPKFIDVHFSFISNGGRVTRIPAHKNLLATNSDVFEKMFYGDLKEDGDVKITDISADVFKEFLQFFYLSQVQLTDEHIAGVLYLGNKYNVEMCVDACVKILKGGLTNENVCTTLSLAIFHDHKDLMKACEMRILLNTSDVLESAGFLECNKNALAHILKMNVLSCSEVDVFQACMAWVRTKSQQNTVSKAIVKRYLGDLYYEIRFASMSIQEFCALESKYKAVLSTDFNTIIRIISQSEVESHKFNVAPRQVKWNEDAILKCDRAFGEDTMLINLKAKRQTRFSTNQPLLLGKFRCGRVVVGHIEPIHDVRSNLPVDVEITEASDLNGANAKSLLKTKAQLQSKDTDVSLPNSVLIRPGLFYTICIRPFPDEHSYYTKELKTQVQLGPDVTVKFHNHTTRTSDGKVTGLISALDFNRI